jgi:hypothetical protein
MTVEKGDTVKNNQIKHHIQKLIASLPRSKKNGREILTYRINPCRLKAVASSPGFFTEVEPFDWAVLTDSNCLEKLFRSQHIKRSLNE